MKFETARVCVLRRTQVPPADLIESNPFEDPEFSYEVVAWPPGEIDGGLLPQVGDQLTLPGYAQPFRVVERALHWPAPSSSEAREGSVQVNLAVEEVAERSSFNGSPFGRPGEQAIRTEGRWLPGEVRHFESQKTLAGNDAVSVQFAIDGVGALAWFVTRNWHAAFLFPDQARPLAALDPIIPREVVSRLALGQRFEVLVGPGYGGRTAIRDVRPQAKEEN